MRTCTADEKLLPAFSLMLPPVCSDCQVPKVARTVPHRSVGLFCGVVWVVVVVSGFVLAFLNVPQAVITTVSSRRIAMLFFIIGLVFYFALQ